MVKIHWSVGVGILCFLGMVFAFFNAKRVPITLAYQTSDEYFTGSSVSHSAKNAVISHSVEISNGDQIHALEPPIADVIFAGKENVENLEPLVNDDANKPPISIGEFIDVDSDWAEGPDKLSDEPPTIIGEFIDIDDFYTEDYSKALSIGEYIHVEP